jgi:hypothetical protein
MSRTLDLRDPKERQRAGLASGTIPPQFWKNLDTVLQEKRAVGDTRRLIVDLVYDSPKPLTRLQIARLIDRKKTPHLIGLIEQLVAEGAITRGCSVAPNGVLTYWYVGIEVQ